MEIKEEDFSETLKARREQISDLEVNCEFKDSQITQFEQALKDLQL